MSKKLIITLSIIFAVVAVVLILMWTLFGLSSVSVRLQSTTENLIVSEDEIVEAGEFRYGATVFFEGKQKSIDKIYDYASVNENFAYIKVVNIETVFPNRFVIHVAEREELFAVEYQDEFLICDHEFRVLKILDNFQSVQGQEILLEGLVVRNESVRVGDFLEIGQESMKNFYSVMLENNRTLAQQLGKFEKMALSTYQDELTQREYTALTLTTYQGRTFVINNIDFALSNKVQLMFAVESSIYNQNVDDDGNILSSDGEPIYVVRTDSGEYMNFDSTQHTEEQKIALTYDLLQNCCIKVDNLTLTDFVDRTENDIYYSFMEMN